MYLELKMQQCMRDVSVFQNLSSKVRLKYLFSPRESERRRWSFYKLNDNRECLSDVFGA